MFVRRCQNLPGASNREGCGRRGLERLSNRVGIEDWNLSEELRIPACQGSFSRTVCSRDEGEGWTTQRVDWLEGGTCFRCRSARISFSRLLSIARPARAACAIFCAISSHFRAIITRILRWVVSSSPVRHRHRRVGQDVERSAKVFPANARWSRFLFARVEHSPF